jgi:geranylgeranyl diphosphate synthase type I
VLKEISEATITLCEGQTRDMMFESKETVSEEEYFEMIRGKTAALFETSARCGGILGGATKKQVKRLGMFGHYSGIAFQVIDDILGLTADKKVLKKPVGNDIREGKRTLMFVYALEKASGSQRRKIIEMLGNKDASPEQIQETINLIDSQTSFSLDNIKLKVACLESDRRKRSKRNNQKNCSPECASLRRKSCPETSFRQAARRTSPV